jgi:hypothetical protein
MGGRLRRTSPEPDVVTGVPLAPESGNGQIVASSGEGYTSKSGAQNGIDAVKRDAAIASMDDQT